MFVILLSEGEAKIFEKTLFALSPLGQWKCWEVGKGVVLRIYFSVVLFAVENPEEV